ncbi:MAG: hypothetical protein DWQ01_17340 [Planctomycetota bacterium]|nr:MAG: hypothetical protein DWQ01_17340 [Planctomycetota bacterium]
MAKPGQGAVDLRRIFRLSLPLAAGWILFGGELPLLTAFMARMGDPERQLAAYGSVVLPITMVLEAPVLMLLSASASLCTDLAAYRSLRRFTLLLTGSITIFHFILAFTPLYEFVVRTILDVPEEVVEPGRWGLRVMTPMVLALGWRRFQQGSMVHFEYSRPVPIGASFRLLLMATVLALSLWSGKVSGIVAATSALVIGVVGEAWFMTWAAAKVLPDFLRPKSGQAESLRIRSLLKFYIPLATTPLIIMFIQPAGTAAMSRMPHALESLAAWPAVYGLVFLARGTGFAFNEVVVALLRKPNAVKALTRFACILAAAMMTLLLVLSVTPLSGFWFKTLSGLPPELAETCSFALLFALLMPAYQAFQSLFQGALVHSRKTKPIFEGVVLYLCVSFLVLWWGTQWQRYTGIYFTLCAFTIGGSLQTLWLAWRARPVLKQLA